MTTINLMNGTLTDERAESSYGQPVLVLDGNTYGVADEVDGGLFGPQPAYKIGLTTNAVVPGGRLDDEQLAMLAKWREMGRSLGLEE